MPTCQIIYIKHRDSFRWKWRSVTPKGVEESERSYALFYECVVAARERGFHLNLKCA